MKILIATMALAAAVHTTSPPQRIDGVPSEADRLQGACIAMHGLIAQLEKQSAGPLRIETIGRAKEIQTVVCGAPQDN